MLSPRVTRYFAAISASSLATLAGFGSFFRYLTFNVFAAQTLFWPLALLADLQPGAARLVRAADDCACALLPLATTVTVLFYALLFMDPGNVVEPGLRPEWLSPAMHLANAAAAWADALAFAPRSFSSRAAGASVVLTSAYAVWIQVVKHHFGSFPYPFLNALPHPRTSVVTTVIGSALMLLIIAVARGVSRLMVGRPPAARKARGAAATAPVLASPRTRRATKLA